MAAANPLDEILNSSVDELAINALVGNLEARLASPSNKEASNSLTDASVNNNHIDTATSSSHSQSTVFISGTPVGSNGDTGPSHKNVVNSHVQSPSPKTDPQLIGINSIINPVNSTQASNILNTHMNSVQLNRSSPVPESNRNQSPHLRTVTNSPGLMNARNSPVPSPSNSNVNSPHSHTIKSYALKTENSAIQNVTVSDQKLSLSQGNCIPIASSHQISLKQEPSVSAQFIVKTENLPVSAIKSEAKPAAIQAVTGPLNSASGNHISATNVHIVNAPIKGQPGVITVKHGTQQVVMRPQIVQNVSNSGQMQVVNVSANSPRPPGIAQVPQQGKPQAMRFTSSPARPSQVHIAPRPGGTTNTITLPPGVQIPPGTVLMRNEQGQLVFVPALQSPSQPTSTPGQRIQYVRPPSSQPQRPPVSQIVTIQPQQPQVARVVRPNTQPVATSAGPPTTSSQAPGQGHAQQPLDNVKKCKNFLSTLIKLASSQPEQTVKNVRELIQGLIDNKVEPEQFTERLQKELKSSPQPYLVPFLRKSLPLLRQSLLENKMHIEGVKPPPIEVMKGTPFIPSAPGVQQHIRLPQHVDGLQIRPRVMPPRPVIPKTAMSAGSNVPSPASAAAAGTSKPHSKPKYESLKDDDDINDVATMGGVNLSEESKNILGSNAEFIGTQIRSCADEAFLYHPALQKRVSCIARKHGLDVQGEVLNLVSHATQERLRDLVEKLATIAEHRIEIYKMNDRFESSTDVKSQLKFIEELDKLEKKRHEEQEWEKIMKAAKSRSKNEDPEQQKIKQKARELQQAENDRMRQKEANLTALAAIGPRKKRRTDNMEHQAGSSSLNLQNGPQSASRATLSRPRIKRVTLRDLLFLMEEERTLCRSKMLYKTFLK